MEKYLFCECGGIIVNYNSRDYCNCEQCQKRYAFHELEYDTIRLNKKTGCIFPMVICETSIDLQIEEIESARQELKKHFGEHYELSTLTHTIPLLEELKELRETTSKYKKEINKDSYNQALKDLLKVMKERADDSSDIPNMFDKGYYQAYEHMCYEAEQLKK